MSSWGFLSGRKKYISLKLVQDDKFKIYKDTQNVKSRKK